MRLRASYLIRVFDALSQLLNVIVFNGESNESVSGRSYRRNWFIRKYIDFVLFWDEKHCKKAYLLDIERARKLLSEEMV